MSRLSAITVQNYRRFSQRTTLELRPLTLLYGWNNSGKSALLRLLPLVRDSVEHGLTGALNLRGEAGRAGQFQDLLWKGANSSTDRSLLLALHFDKADLSRIEYRIDLNRETNTSYIKALAAFRGDEEVLAMAHAPGAPLPFSGLLPNLPTADRYLRQIHVQMAELRDGIQWLGGVRKIDRLYPMAEAPRRLSHDGHDAPDVLRLDDELRRVVSGWYEDDCGSALSIQSEHKHYRILLRPAQTEMDIDLVDNGEGMIQVLPVLTAAAMAAAAGGPRVVAVEEAESHLHPNAQRDLARHLCDLAEKAEPPILMLETHSEVLMLQVQLEIASKKISPEKVQVYWMEQELDGSSTARQVLFDERGQPKSGVLAGTFAETDELAREVFDARSRHR